MNNPIENARKNQIKNICINEIGYTPTIFDLEVLDLNCITINDIADQIDIIQSKNEQKQD